MPSARASMRLVPGKESLLKSVIYNKNDISMGNSMPN
jgi:hypothetical protein